MMMEPAKKNVTGENIETSCSWLENPLLKMLRKEGGDQWRHQKCSFTCHLTYSLIAMNKLFLNSEICKPEKSNQNSINRFVFFK